MSRSSKKNPNKSDDQLHDNPVNSELQTSNKQENKQETVQEVLEKLEKEFNIKLETLNELREEYNKIRDKIVSAHDDVFRAYQKLSITKESFLFNTINVQQKELSKYIPQRREDNVVHSVEEESG